MDNRDETVARLLAECPFPTAKFHSFAEGLVGRDELKPADESEKPETTFQKVSDSLERVLATEDWRHRVTVHANLTGIPHNPSIQLSDRNHPSFHAAHLTALVWVGMQRITAHEPREFGWMSLLGRLRSFSLIRGVFPWATDLMINGCLMKLHQEGSIVFERSIAIPQLEPTTLG